MLLRAIALACALAASAAQAAVDVNLASQAELEAVSGIGPSLAEAILQERGRAAFRDWPDLMRRVKGLGAARAARLSAEGLTVDGARFDASTAPPAAAR
jgi:competence protein ComEA